MKKMFINDSDIDNVVNTLHENKSIKKKVKEDKYSYEQMLSESVTSFKKGKNYIFEADAPRGNARPQGQPRRQGAARQQNVQPAVQPVVQPAAPVGYVPPVPVPSQPYAPGTVVGPTSFPQQNMTAPGVVAPVIGTMASSGQGYTSTTLGQQPQAVPQTELHPEEVAQPSLVDRVKTGVTTNATNAYNYAKTNPGKTAAGVAAVAGAGAIVATLLKKIREKNADPETLKAIALKQCGRIQDPGERQSCIEKVTQSI